MKFNSFEDLRCLKPKKVLEEEERQERRNGIQRKAQFVAIEICKVVKAYYHKMADYHNKSNPVKNKPTKPELEELEIVYDYVERHGLKYIDSNNTENDEVFYASELTKVLHKIQSKYIGNSLSSFKTFIKKFI